MPSRRWAPTHDDLVRKACSWLRNTLNCAVVAPELTSWVGEQPDAVGWRDAGQTCVIVECKVSRADFRQDLRKHFRLNGGDDGAGHLRYYLTTQGIIKIEELPPGWGLLEAYGARIRVVKFAERQDLPRDNRTSEIMMYSLLRRITEKKGLSLGYSPKWAKRFRHRRTKPKRGKANAQAD